MKSSKNKENSLTLATEREEECGIWLDTKELKEKKQQKLLCGPFSGLLKPVLRPRDFDSLRSSPNKPKFPKVTRQSSINSFFSSKHTGSSQAGVSTSTCSETHSGAKRNHSTTLDLSRELTDNPSEMVELKCDVQGLSKKDKLETHLRHSSQGEEPPEKKRFVSQHEGLYKDAQNENQLCTDPITDTKSKSSESIREHFLQSPAPKNAETLILGEQKDNLKGSVLTSRAVNAIRSPNKHQENSFKSRASPVKWKGKENNWCTSPVKSPPSSPFKPSWLELSPAKAWRKEDTKTFSPKRCCWSSSLAGETLGGLFTQDSEGFFVIAHCQGHSKDKSKEDPRQEEEEEEILFTQDSEGNMVIKH
ncbi:hypothetical protein DNTS_003596 [Danionella cerebrum]|uniref:Aurora kinase A and ninein-interacting protein n=1 Tax=Danionella cerebrum TaxID=2873325 RepID=A0A553RHS0_9TELE|nr:hypothetical protein DNTS_003596 [Danionella translucida]